jgi:ketosteroid isomerase-like protein
MKTDTATRSDLDALTALNRDYIHSVQIGDVQRFEEILAEDFLCSNPDGSLVDKKQFLAQRARHVTISGLSVEDVRVRILGDVAITHARTSYTTSGGDQRNGRYTDVWSRRDGRWLAVSAHVTRQPCSKPTFSSRGRLWAPYGPGRPAKFNAGRPP